MHAYSEKRPSGYSTLIFRRCTPGIGLIVLRHLIQPWPKLPGSTFSLVMEASFLRPMLSCWAYGEDRHDRTEGTDPAGARVTELVRIAGHGSGLPPADAFLLGVR